ncbi:MAG: class I adenylate-forming enzyme family protein, partial [Rhodospirillales bacterium]|nr:class I adenylate-forming enzyme family protein [Rhodospirillales bacterium]
GYFNDPEEFKRSFNSDGWFMTGDLGWVDEAGYIRVTGRKKELIIRGGHNINPAKIESLALRHKAVERAAAIPVADERLGEKVCIAVQLQSSASLGAQELLSHLDECKLSKYDMPEYFLELDDIPLTPSGKLFKRGLVGWVQEGRVKPIPVRFEPKG